MSEIETTATEGQPEPQLATPDQALAQIQKILSDNGLSMMVFAVGARTGEASNIADFMPPTHTAQIRIFKQAATDK